MGNQGGNFSQTVSDGFSGIGNACNKDENDAYEDLDVDPIDPVTDILKANIRKSKEVSKPKPKHPMIKGGEENINRVFDDSDSDIVAAIDGSMSSLEQQRENLKRNKPSQKNDDEDQDEVFEVEPIRTPTREEIEENKKRKKKKEKVVEEEEEEAIYFHNPSEEEEEKVMGIDSKPPQMNDQPKKDDDLDEDDEDVIDCLDNGSFEAEYDSLPPFESNKKKKEEEDDDESDEPVVPYIEKSHKEEEEEDDDDEPVGFPEHLMLKIPNGIDSDDDEPVKPPDQELMDELERESRMIEQAEKEAEDLISEFKRQ